MTSPKLPPELPPVTDPDNIEEVYCNDVVVQVRNGGVQMTFISSQAVSYDADGQVNDRRVIRSRVAMPIEVAQQMLAVFEQIGQTIRAQNELASVASRGEKPN